jgi:hypothetical protein
MDFKKISEISLLAQIVSKWQPVEDDESKPSNAKPAMTREKWIERFFIAAPP